MDQVKSVTAFFTFHNTCTPNDISNRECLISNRTSKEENKSNTYKTKIMELLVCCII